MIDEEFFANPRWYEVKLPLPDEALCEALYDQHQERMVDYAEYWALRHYGAAWIDFYEWPGEIPIACPNGVLAYRMCARLPDYPHGVWVHVLMDQQGTMLGARIDAD